jgi:flavodoxin short chain
MGKTAIIYWSGTGNTEAMAKAIERGMKSAGAEVDLLSVDRADAGVLEGYAKFAFGCPSMGSEELEDSVFAPFFDAAEGKLDGKPVALFGSYGWGDGEWMRTWQTRTSKAGAALFEEGLIQQEAPDETVCEQFGARFAAV